MILNNYEEDLRKKNKAATNKQTKSPANRMVRACRRVSQQPRRAAEGHVEQRPRECGRACSSAHTWWKVFRPKCRQSTKQFHGRKGDSRHSVAAAEKAEERLGLQGCFYSSLPENPEEQQEVLSTDIGHRILALFRMS